MGSSTTFGRLRQKSRAGSVSGFSLIELLVVIIVIAIMAALLLPALSKTKDQARGTACRSNMKQLALAFLMYAEENDDTFPWPGGAGRAITAPSQYSADWCATPPDMSGMTLNLASVDLPGFGHNAECGSIFPYVMSQPRQEYDPMVKEKFPVYRCPSSGRLGEGLRVNYSANGWMDPGSPFGTSFVSPKGITTSSVVDSSRKVLLICEDPLGMQTPAFPPLVPSRKAALHLNRANVAFMDGHLESVLSKTFTQMRINSSFYFNAGK